MSDATKPVASLSIDLDNVWAYRRAAGHDDWESSEDILPRMVPRIVDAMNRHGLPLTVFFVGRDLDATTPWMEHFERLVAFEPANHSWNHLPWMHLMDDDEMRAEIERTEAAIVERTGRRPTGFRGPGFSCPPEVVRILMRRGYRYDASFFPTSIAPVSRQVFLWTSKLRGAERERAKKLYGGIRSTFQPNRPHVRIIDGQRLAEIPVTTMPLFRLPIHMSYFMFLASKSEWVAKRYFSMALRLCRWTGTPPSLLLHPPDFFGRGEVPSMDYFPGVAMDVDRKSAAMDWALKRLRDGFDVVTLNESVRRLDLSANADMDTEPTPITIASSPNPQPIAQQPIRSDAI